MSIKSYGLYPPIVDSDITVWCVDEDLRFYFKISDYMGISSIRTDMVIVSIVDSETNNSVINPANNFNSDQVLICNLQQDDRDGRYYITVGKSAIKTSIGRRYKIQLCFCGKNFPVTKDELRTNFYNYLHLDEVSEWSQIGVIKTIVKPTLTIRQFSDGKNISSVLFSQSLQVNGYCDFNENVDEYLSFFRVYIYSKDNLSVPIVDSGEIIPSSTNTIDYIVKEILNDNEDYRLRIVYSSNNGYSSYKDYDFTIQLREDGRVISSNKIRLNFVNNKEEAAFVIDVSYDEVDAAQDGWIMIRRTDSDSDYKKWEDFYCFEIKSPEIRIKNVSSDDKEYFKIIKDRTVECGKFYLYGVVPISADGYRMAQAFNREKKKLCVFEDTFLVVNDNLQYNIKTNLQVDNFKYNVIESKTDTIGGKYPFIRRNANTYYRQFSLSGLITHFWEQDNPEEESAENILNIIEGYQNNVIDTYKEKIEKFVLKDRTSEYNDYIRERNEQSSLRNINKWTDSLLEKGYRDIVIKDLYENKPFLFKSPTEGNILVKLMDISFNPDNLLNRHVYSFSTTAYEIDENDLTTLVAYRIHDKGAIGEELFDSSRYVVGQIILDDESANEDDEDGQRSTIDIFEKIQKNLNAHDQLRSYTIESLHWIKFEYDLEKSPPELCNTSQYNFEQIEFDIDTDTDIINDPNFVLRAQVLDYYDSIWELFRSDKIYTEEDIINRPCSASDVGLTSNEIDQILYLYVKLGEFLLKKRTDTNNNIFSYWNLGTNQWNYGERGDDRYLFGEKDYCLFSRQTLNSKTLFPQKELYTILEGFANCDNFVADAHYIWFLMAAIMASAETNSQQFLKEHSKLFNDLSNSGFFFENEDVLIRYEEAGYYSSVISSFTESAYALALARGLQCFDKTGKEYKKIGGVDSTDPSNAGFSRINIEPSFTTSLSVVGQDFLFFFFNVLAPLAIYCYMRNQVLIKDVAIINPDEEIQVEEADQTAIRGYPININNTNIIVSPLGYYELNDEDTYIYNAHLYKTKGIPLDVSIDWIAKVQTFTNETQYSKTIIQYYIVGQYIPTAEEKYSSNLNKEQQNIIQKIKNKYTSQNNSNIFHEKGGISIEAKCVPYLSIEAEPYTEFKIIDTADNDNNENVEDKTHNYYIMNNTGILTLYNENTCIEELYLLNSHQESIQERGEVIFDKDAALDDILINYIVLVQEERY